MLKIRRVTARELKIFTTFISHNALTCFPSHVFSPTRAMPPSFLLLPLSLYASLTASFVNTVVSPCDNREVGDTQV